MGDDFAALTKPQWKLCNSVSAIGVFFPKPGEDQKKCLPSPKIELFFPWNQVKTKKKKIFTAIWDYDRPEFEGFIRAGWLLIVSSSSAQILMGGRLNLDGGTLTLDGGTHPPAYPQQFTLSTDLQYWKTVCFGFCLTNHCRLF